jgi:hypothetical protein
LKTALTLALLLTSSAAYAGPPGETPPVQPQTVRPTWMWTIGTLVRSTASNPGDDDALVPLEEYGWETRSPALWGLRGDVAYLQAPIVDVGVAFAWAKGTYAQGPLFDDPDTITGSTLEAGLFGRVHWVRASSPAAAEPRAEVGVARTTSTMRGVDAHDVGLYTRIGLDFRLGGRRGGAMFSVDYTSVRGTDDSALDLPTSGLNFSLSFYWRHW